MSHAIDQFEAGQRVKVVQQIPQRDEVWTHEVVGSIMRYEQRKSGSWFAHSKDDKIWLDRLVLRKDDGEIVTCNLDRYSHVELLDETAAPPQDEAHRSAPTAGAAVDHGPAGKDPSGAVET